MTEIQHVGRKDAGTSSINTTLNGSLVSIYMYSNGSNSFDVQITAKTNIIACYLYERYKEYPLAGSNKVVPPILLPDIGGYHNNSTNEATNGYYPINYSTNEIILHGYSNCISLSIYCTEA